MKILMVSSFLPYPLFNGGNIRLYNLLKNLSHDYEITLICEKREFQTQKDINEIEKFCKKVITVNRKKQWSFGNILRSGFSLDPFLIVGHTSLEMKNKIKRELTEGNFDLIHVETFYVMQNLPKTTLPIVLVEHNIEYLVYKRFVDHSPIFLRPFLNWDVQKMKRRENFFWGKAKVLVAVSERERKLMDADEVLPNGVDINKFKIKSSDLNIGEGEKRILFIGDFKWLENRDTAKWIIKKIWPELKSKIDVLNIKLWIVGRKIPDNIKNLTQDPNVIFDENAPEDTSLIYKKSFLLLSPIRMGGGTSFKILEAMSSGIPVITTSLGAEGIADADELIKANDVDQISNSILRLINDKVYYEKIAKKVRSLIEKKFNWEIITEKLEKIYKEVLHD